MHHARGSRIDRQGAHETHRIDAEMIVEAAILGREHGLQQMIGKFAQGYGRVLLQPALADLDAVAPEKGHRKILPRQEIVARETKGRLRQHQKPDRAYGAERRRFAQELHQEPAEP